MYTLEIYPAVDRHNRPVASVNAIIQFYRPNIRFPVWLMNLPLEVGVEQRPFMPPAVQSTRPMAEDEDGLCGNLTPVGTVVDLHIDQLRDGLVMCIGRSVKVVLMWPGTAENMAIMTEVGMQPGRFAMAAPRLRHGIIVYLNNNSALFFPILTIHMTITLAGGPLIGLNTVTAQNIEAACTNLAYELAVSIEPNQVGNLVIFSRQVNASARSPVIAHRIGVLTGWVRLQPSLTMWFTRDRRDRDGFEIRELAHVQSIIRRLLQDLVKGGFFTHCCNVGQDEVIQHYQASHFMVLSNSSKQSRTPSSSGTSGSKRRAKEATTETTAGAVKKARTTRTSSNANSIIPSVATRSRSTRSATDTIADGASYVESLDSEDT